MRIHGDKLHIDTGTEGEDDVNTKKEEEDFFSSQNSSDFPTVSTLSVSQPAEAKTTSLTMEMESGPAPDVSQALSGEAVSKAAPRKTTIGTKKPAGKKSGLG